MKTLYYIHDPMCSWCWAFSPVWQQVQKKIPPSIQIQYLLGGLAPDNTKAMPMHQQHSIQNHWKTIQQQVPGTAFNFDFWQLNRPQRSTYPACRAVLAATNQAPSYEQAMILAIQQAYYLQAKNPSLDEVLHQCAASLGLNISQFQDDLRAEKTQSQLLGQIKYAQSMQAFSFPSLVLRDDNNQVRPIHINYCNAKTILNQLPNNQRS